MRCGSSAEKACQATAQSFLLFYFLEGLLKAFVSSHSLVHCFIFCRVMIPSLRNMIQEDLFIIITKYYEKEE